jgi:hypothetical protein
MSSTVICSNTFRPQAYFEQPIKKGGGRSVQRLIVRPVRGVGPRRQSADERVLGKLSRGNLEEVR